MIDEIVAALAEAVSMDGLIGELRTSINSLRLQLERIGPMCGVETSTRRWDDDFLHIVQKLLC